LDEAYLFVSYSRDDAEFAQRLVEFLRARGVPAWIDQLIPNGTRWRQTLAERIERAAAVLLIESVSAQASTWVNEEFLWADKNRIPLLVVVIDGDLRFGLRGLNAEFLRDGAMPGEAFVAQARKCVDRVNTGSISVKASPPRRHWQFPPIPAGMVERPVQVNAIAAALTQGQGAVGVSGLFGAGGFGKTIAARMACARADVQDRFPGGLLWIELGQERRGPALAAVLTETCQRLGGPPVGSGIESAGQALAGLLADRPATLVVLDDVWFPDQLSPFLDHQIGAARYLITTRISTLLPDDAILIKLDQLDAEQSRQVLSHDLPELSAELGKRLLALTGGWALAVKAANSVLRTAVRDGRDLAATAKWLADTLEAEGPDVLNLGQERSRTKTIAATLQASLRLLDESDRARYLELGIFAEDTDIDFATLSLLWGATGRMNLRDARRLVAALYEQSLITDYRPETSTLRLHDVVRAYLRERMGPAEVLAHQALMDAAAHHFALASEPGAVSSWAWWDLPASAGYLWRHLAGHLVRGDRRAELDALLTDLRWFAAKARQVSVADLDADLSRGRGPAVEALRRALRLEGHLFGSIDPCHSHDDLVAARLETDARLVGIVNRFRAGLDTNFARLIPAWPLPDGPDPCAIRVLTGHSSAVSALAVAPDGSWLVSASNDQTIRIWDVATGTERAMLAGNTSGVRALAVAPDGSWLVSASNDHAVRIWDVATGTERATLVGHASEVCAVAIAPDGSWLASGSDDQTVRIWDIATGAERTVLTGHTGWVRAVAIAPDGSWLASGGAGADGTVRVWDVGTGAERTVLNGHSSWIRSMAISPTGSWLASASADGTLRIWDAHTGLDRATLTGHTGGVNAVAAGPDGSWLVSGGAGADGTVRVWDAATGAEHATLTGHTSWVNTVAVAPDGSWLASASNDHTIRIWDAATGTKDRARLTGRIGWVNAVAVAPDGSWLASGGADRTIRIWDAHTGTERGDLRGHIGWVNAVAVAPDGSWLASAGADSVVRIWDVATGAFRVARTGHMGGLRAMAIAPDRSWLASGGADGTLRIWDVTVGVERFVLTGHTGWVWAVAIAPDGSWLATGGADRTIRIWDVPAGSERCVLSGHAGGVWALAVAPDGSWLASGGDDQAVRIWDVATGAERRVLTGHTGEIRAMTLSPDGAWLASVDADGIVRIWDVATEANIASTRVAGPLMTVAISSVDFGIFTAGAAGVYRLRLSSPANHQSPAKHPDQMPLTRAPAHTSTARRATD
jgi:WD40 repeat protein